MRPILLAFLLLRVSPAATVYGFFTNGQSLSIGTSGNCGSSSSPHFDCPTGAAYGNLMLANATGADSGPHQTGALTTLLEPSNKLAGSETNVEPSSLNTSLGNQYAAMSGRIALVDHYGVGGVGYSYVKKGGTCCYNGYLEPAMGFAKTNVEGVGNAYLMPTSFMILGQSDWVANVTNTTWKSNMVQYQGDYQGNANTDVNGSGKLVPLVIGQIASCWTRCPASGEPVTNVGGLSIPSGQYEASEDHYTDGTIFLAQPEYQFTYSDTVHMTAASYRQYGAKMGQVAYEIGVLKRGWKWGHVRTVSVSGTTVSVRFWVHTLPLVLDHSVSVRANEGFEVFDAGDATTAISTTPAITGDTVSFSLNHAPSGTLDVAYAWTRLGSTAGIGNGNWGNLHDSDPTVCWWGSCGSNDMVNWTLQFRKTAPYTWEPAEPNLETVPGAPLTALFPMPGGFRVVR